MTDYRAILRARTDHDWCMRVLIDHAIRCGRTLTVCVLY